MTLSKLLRALLAAAPPQQATVLSTLTKKEQRSCLRAQVTIPFPSVRLPGFGTLWAGLQGARETAQETAWTIRTPCITN